MAGRHTQFAPGVSGNPRGRPPGRKNKKTALKNLVEAVLAAVNEHGPGTFFRQLSSRQRAQVYIRAMELEHEREMAAGICAPDKQTISLTLLEVERQEAAEQLQRYKQVSPPIVGADFHRIAPSNGDD